MTEFPMKIDALENYLKIEKLKIGNYLMTANISLSLTM